jgi:hypothetical protein
VNGLLGGGPRWKKQVTGGVSLKGTCCPGPFLSLSLLPGYHEVRVCVCLPSHKALARNHQIMLKKAASPACSKGDQGH